MLSVITTKFLGPTTNRGARIVAKASQGSVTIPMDYEAGVDGSHRAAAKALAQKLEWEGQYVGGWTETGAVFVRCFSLPLGVADFTV